jgi:hypothetical protein
MGRKLSFDERYMPIPETGCWLWTGTWDENGYGKMIGGRAHRISYAMHVGPIPAGLCVLHRCDTPACVNPAHLWLGTHLENMADMGRKGRSRCKKLNATQVLEIRDSRETLVTLAEKFGVTFGMISHIRRRWRRGNVV